MTRTLSPLVLAFLLLDACGSSPSTNVKPTLALAFSKCSVSGSLQATSGAGAPRTVKGDTCVGGAFDGGGAGTGIDIGVDVGGRTALHVTINAATTNQSLQIETSSPSLDDQSYYLGAAVPAGVVWVRHRAAGSGSLFAPMRGGVTVGAVAVAPGACADVCSHGTVTVELTFDHAMWDSPSGPVDYTGKIVITASGGDKYCSTSSDCAEGRACNESTTGTSYCGKTNATGADLGQACASSDACKSNDCDPSGQCSLHCKTDDDCSNGTLCVQNFRTSLKSCVRSCAANTDCADLPSKVPCGARGNADSSALVGVCGDGPGSGTFAQSSADDCDTDLSIVPVGMPAVCTRLCRTSADCAPPLATCQSRAFRDARQTFSAITMLMVCQ